MTTPNHKSWAHHWKLKDGESFKFVYLPDATALETVHEFYKIGTSKKMTIECRDNCPFCAASIEFSDHEMKVMARQFKPKEYKIFQGFISYDPNNITIDSSIKLMRLPIKDFKKLQETGEYWIQRNGSKFDIEIESFGFEIDGEYEVLPIVDYVHRDSDQSIRDKYAFILNSIRNN